MWGEQLLVGHGTTTCLPQVRPFALVWKSCCSGFRGCACLFINLLYILNLGNASLGKKEMPWVVCALDEVREPGRLH